MGCEASRSSSRRKQTRECPAPVCKAVWVRWDKIPAFWRWVRSLDLTLPHRVRLAALNSVADRAFGSQAQERAGQQHRRPAVHHDVHRGPQGVCRGPPRWDDRGADSRHRRTSARVCDSRRHCLGAHQAPKPLLGDGRGSQPARESSCVLRDTSCRRAAEQHVHSLLSAACSVRPPTTCVTPASRGLTR